VTGACCPRRTSLAWAWRTAFPRANGHVRAAQGDVAELVAQGIRAGVSGASGATTWPGAFWSVPVHALSCACTFWTRLGTLVLVNADVHLVKGRQGQHQQGLGKLRDMVEWLGWERRGGEHVE
jgi:hypothetical protein